VRPCPTCDCFVPVTARRCPRCEAALEPVCEEVGARHAVLVGAGWRASQPCGAGEATASNVMARLSLPPLDSPALRPRRRQLPKLPQPFAPDPLVLAVFLGIPPVTPHDDANAPEVTPDGTDDAVDRPMPLAGSGITFGALLGTSVAAAVPPSPSPTPPPNPVPVPPVAVPLVAVPLAAADIAVVGVRADSRRSRRSPRDPFRRTTTRRERVLARLCMTLAIMLALAVLVLRLPLGPRPELGATDTVGRSASSIASSPFSDAIRKQTHTDLRAVITTAQRLDLVFGSYVPVTPVILNRYLPQFGFVWRGQTSQRVGELSVATSAHVLVVAEYAGTGQCAFARVIDQHMATSVGPTQASCAASATPPNGWTALTP